MQLAEKKRRKKGKKKGRKNNFERQILTSLAEHQRVYDMRSEDNIRRKNYQEAEFDQYNQIELFVSTTEISFNDVLVF